MRLDLARSPIGLANYCGYTKRKCKQESIEIEVLGEGFPEKPTKLLDLYYLPATGWSAYAFLCLYIAHAYFLFISSLFYEQSI